MRKKNFILKHFSKRKIVVITAFFLITCLFFISYSSSEAYSTKNLFNQPKIEKISRVGEAVNQDNSSSFRSLCIRPLKNENFKGGILSDPYYYDPYYGDNPYGASGGYGLYYYDWYCIPDATGVCPPSYVPDILEGYCCTPSWYNYYDPYGYYNEPPYGLWPYGCGGRCWSAPPHFYNGRECAGWVGCCLNARITWCEVLAQDPLSCIIQARYDATQAIFDFCVPIGYYYAPGY